MKFIMMQTRKLPELLQIVLNISLFLMAIVLSVLLMKETWSIFSSVFLSSEEIDSYFAFTDELLVFFLYFEFIALIVKYFKSNFHFPLRYFIYIGITAIVRLIIVDHDEALSTFWWSMAILVLIGSLFLANTRVVRKDH
ncbi:phosphate-starvation-inducible protein PsiE [Paenibacillus shenyangensis]|uniref:phosphate-starvation-inducible protein PsiE n=1 Tax=Paenibacillus sp. A9 TaxID=1284352 RepID=UPI0004765734|nr:phosphate-starvation-inducible protein PsiE [Paenibacillus sp. A9]